MTWLSECTFYHDTNHPAFWKSQLQSCILEKNEDRLPLAKKNNGNFHQIWNHKPLSITRSVGWVDVSFKRFWPSSNPSNDILCNHRLRPFGCRRHAAPCSRSSPGAANDLPWWDFSWPFFVGKPGVNLRARTHDSWNYQQPQWVFYLHFENLNTCCFFLVFAQQKISHSKTLLWTKIHMFPSGTWFYPAFIHMLSSGLCDLIKAHAIGLRRFNSCPALRWTGQRHVFLCFFFWLFDALPKKKETPFH